MINYKEKYLKYKNKYINLKQYGGVIDLTKTNMKQIFTSNNRINFNLTNYICSDMKMVEFTNVPSKNNKTYNVMLCEKKILEKDNIYPFDNGRIYHFNLKLKINEDDKSIYNKLKSIQNVFIKDIDTKDTKDNINNYNKIYINLIKNLNINLDHPLFKNKNDLQKLNTIITESFTKITEIKFEENFTFNENKIAYQVRIGNQTENKSKLKKMIEYIIGNIYFYIYNNEDTLREDPFGEDEYFSKYYIIRKNMNNPAYLDFKFKEETQNINVLSFHYLNNFTKNRVLFCNLININQQAQNYFENNYKGTYNGWDKLKFNEIILKDCIDFNNKIETHDKDKGKILNRYLQKKLETEVTDIKNQTVSINDTFDFDGNFFTYKKNKT